MAFAFTSHVIFLDDKPINDWYRLSVSMILAVVMAIGLNPCTMHICTLSAILATRRFESGGEIYRMFLKFTDKFVSIAPYCEDFGHPYPGALRPFYKILLRFCFHYSFLTVFLLSSLSAHICGVSFCGTYSYLWPPITLIHWQSQCW